MKLLFVVPSFYDDRLPKKVKTGQAIISGDLYSSFSEKFDVFVTGYPVKGIDLGYTNIIPTSFVKLIQYTRISDIKDSIEKFAYNYKYYGLLKGLKEAAKTLFCKALTREFACYLELNPCDIVAIHDFSQGNLEVLKICMEKKVNCIVTLHVYVGRNTILTENTYHERAEREGYLFLNSDDPIMVVSSGLKRRILEDYKNVSPERITIIPNGTRLPKIGSSETTCFGDNRKLILCIGTISDRKNQAQLLLAPNFLPEEIREQVKVLFIGEDRLHGQLQKDIVGGSYEDVAEYVGAIEHEKMAFYFRNAFAAISTSLNEAFGLTFIEGFCYGLSAIFFDDIDAVDELYDPNAVELIRGKQCCDIAMAISDTVNRAWNKEKIKGYARKFNIRKTSNLYEEYYRKVCGGMVNHLK